MPPNKKLTLQIILQMLRKWTEDQSHHMKVKEGKNKNVCSKEAIWGQDLKKEIQLGMRRGINILWRKRDRYKGKEKVVFLSRVKSIKKKIPKTWKQADY